VAFGAVGSLPEQGPLHPARAIDFHDVKGAVEQVLARFQTRAVYFDRFPADAGLTPDWLHPYRSARVAVDGETVGWFGQLHPREAAARKLREPVLAGELYLDRLYKLNLRKTIAREISRFQPVRRDFSLVLEESVGWEKINQALAGLQIPELVDWGVREVFRDARLGHGAGSHAARGRVAGLSGAGCGSGGQSRSKAAQLEGKIGAFRGYTCSVTLHLSGGP
jgi:phenylalanyl-tRNA synthetase beta chain